ncbi:PepSY domain-containing protein [Methylorubrum salsuginis]|uniref:PepSY-associated TM region n=1 Tax=Methylorubrum salsuginis TaxID=414703 RepID=A0A1I4C5L8_9HYPH|nr:PepSY domain-containing protein [Methylorubrum salsuginis]SFK76418.1 PepSY-associated TM region [Methylorubrum salsuginis]
MVYGPGGGAPASDASFIDVTLSNFGKRALRWLLLGHRWLGIVFALVFAVWFLSGAVMMYVGFPRLSEAERRAVLPPLALPPGMIGPDAALAAAKFSGPPARIDLGMLGDAPVYRVSALDGTRITVSALDGRAIAGGDPALLLEVAKNHPAARAVEDLGAVTWDQWTVPQRFNPLRPFRLVALGDAAGTRLYLSERTGEVVLDTTASERFWNWLGAVPHWIYLTPLRAEPALWRDVVLWVSGIAIAVAVSGYILGLSRLRLKPRYATGRTTPYRGFAAWHHLGGLIGGTALLTFIVSGWLSMNPNRWFSPALPDAAALARYAGTEAAPFRFDPAEATRICPDLKEIRFTRAAGVPVARALCGQAPPRPCCGSAAPNPDRLAHALAGLMPGEGAPRLERIEREDAYWYGDRETRPLPVLRAVFADPAATWIHLDPDTGEILGRMDRSNRVSRWLFNGLHTLDFARLPRPAWDVVMGLWLSAGFLVAVTGLVIGWRRLKRRFG